ncbi:MAG: hypothetical protein Kow00121_65670 [Elainellaceae cyanobacterium]
MLQITSYPTQVRVEEFLTIRGVAPGLAGQPLTLTIDDRYQNGAGRVASDETWSVRFRFTQPGNRSLVFSVETAQGNITRSQPIVVTVVPAPPPSLEVLTYPSQVRTEEFLTVSGTAYGYEGKTLTLTFDDQYQTGAGQIPDDGNWSVQFRFTQPGNRRLVFSLQDDRGSTIRSEPITIAVVTAPPSGITITSYPVEVRIREPFMISGTSTGLVGKSVVLTIDNEFKTSAGTVAADGSWQIPFQFLQPGTRRLTASVDNNPNGLVISETVTVTVIAVSLQLTITPPTQSPQAGETFILRGEARNFENGEQLVVRADRQYVLARPTVQNQRWEAAIFFLQSGRRLVEVLASEQQRAQIELNVAPSQSSLLVFPYTVWTSVSTPDSIPDLINPMRITLHHTVIAALPANATQDQEIQRMRFILNIHLNSSGYSDIGYHYIIMPSGRIYEGRSSQKRGAHDVVNDGFGVAVDGDFQDPRRITQKQFETIVALCTMLCKRMGIKDPVTPVTTRTADFGIRQLPRIMGHRDRVATGCPGTIYTRLNEIRQAVRARL